ncbi:hypothetical integral membrane protein DUF56 family [Plasmodium ovale wallikeri]|nr:hypothetical integral membrane protein DUF56 family [Plasmodium ovale wallikeri]
MTQQSLCDFALSKTGTIGLQVIMRVILWEKNSTLLISWFAITVLYLAYINNLKRDNKKLPYLRKHYHFLLFLNVGLSFVFRKVELLTFTLTALFLFFILVEIVRKVCEYVFVSFNVVNTFITSVYIPIIIDVLFNNKNYVQTKGAAIGGLLFPTPKMKHTNNKSVAGNQSGEFLCFFYGIYFWGSIRVYYRMAYIKAPSDITILEYKYSRNNERRKINFLKRLFIHCSFFTIGNNCNKLNSNDVIQVLSNVYSGDVSDSSSNANTISILNILNTRQNDIENQVRCKLFSFIGLLFLPMYGMRKFRYYDTKSKMIIFPFFSIAGMYLGSFVGNLVTGRFGDYKRTKFLGTLPANTFLKE